MPRIRAISELLALLIVIVILVGVGIAVALMTSTLSQRLQPSGSSVTIYSAIAKITKNSELEIEATVSISGTYSVRPVKALLEISGKSYTGTIIYPKNALNSWYEPGTTITFTIKFTVSSTSGNMRLIMEFIDTSGKTIAASARVMLG